MGSRLTDLTYHRYTNKDVSQKWENVRLVVVYSHKEMRKIKV